MAECSRSNYAAHDPHRVLEVLFAKNILCGAGLTSHTANVVNGLGQHQGSRSEAEQNQSSAHEGLLAH